MINSAINQNKILVWFGNNLRKIRKKKGLSQMALAELAEVDFSYYGTIERGEKAITIQKLSQITRALNIPMQDLFQDEPETKTNTVISEKEEKLEKIIALLQKSEIEDLSLVHNLISKIFNWQKRKIKSLALPQK